MAQTFDIRFDAAGNSFGWKGGGLLRIDGQGLSFALKRGIASLLARRKSQRIPADKIREVYREGEVLRVEFATDEIPRATLPFRVRDRDTAAHIMQLLPTSRTVEVDDGPVDPRGNPTHPAWIGPVAIVLVLAAAVWVVGLKRPAKKPSWPRPAILPS
jgi:hypothetical protein